MAVSQREHASLVVAAGLGLEKRCQIPQSYVGRKRLITQSFKGNWKIEAAGRAPLGKESHLPSSCLHG